MKHLGDITKINGAEAPATDIVVGGSPCQDLSVAGLRKGIRHSEVGDDETTRSGLAYEMFRIIKEMRNGGRRTDGSIQPGRFALWENVPGALSASASDGGKGTAFQCVLTEFIRVKEEQAPIVPIPKNGWPDAGCIIFANGTASLAYKIIDLQFWGCPQRRRRIALLCDYNGLSAPKILFEQYPGAGYRPEVPPVSKGLCGDSCESGEEGKESAGTAEKGSVGYSEHG